MKVNTSISTVIAGENISLWQLCESIDSHKISNFKKQKKMKAFKLFKTYYSYIENKVVKEPFWTEVLKKDLVKILNQTEKQTICGCRINECTLLVHVTSNNVSMDFVYTIEEVNI